MRTPRPIGLFAALALCCLSALPLLGPAAAQGTDAPPPYASAIEGYYGEMAADDGFIVAPKEASPDEDASDESGESRTPGGVWVRSLSIDKAVEYDKYVWAKVNAEIQLTVVDTTPLQEMFGSMGISTQRDSVRMLRNLESCIMSHVVFRLSHRDGGYRVETTYYVSSFFGDGTDRLPEPVCMAMGLPGGDSEAREGKAKVLLDHPTSLKLPPVFQPVTGPITAQQQSDIEALGRTAIEAYCNADQAAFLASWSKNAPGYYDQPLTSPFTSGSLKLSSLEMGSVSCGLVVLKAKLEGAPGSGLMRVRVGMTDKGWRIWSFDTMERDLAERIASTPNPDRQAMADAGGALKNSVLAMELAGMANGMVIDAYFPDMLKRWEKAESSDAQLLEIWLPLRDFTDTQKDALSVSALAERIARDVGDRSVQARTLAQRSRLICSTGHFKSGSLALKEAQDALNLAGDDKQLRNEALVLVGDLMSQFMAYDVAAKAYDQLTADEQSSAMNQGTSRSAITDKAWALCACAEAHVWTKNPLRGAEIARAALDAAGKAGDPASQFRAGIVLVCALTMNGDYDAALAQLNSVASSLSGKDVEGANTLKALRAEILRQSGKCAEALSEYQSLLNGYKDIHGVPTAANGVGFNEDDIYAGMADAQYSLRDWKSAAENYQKAMGSQAYSTDRWSRYTNSNESVVALLAGRENAPQYLYAKCCVNLPEMPKERIFDALESSKARTLMDTVQCRRSVVLSQFTDKEKETEKELYTSLFDLKLQLESLKAKSLNTILEQEALEQRVVAAQRDYGRTMEQLVGVMRMKQAFKGTFDMGNVAAQPDTAESGTAPQADKAEQPDSQAPAQKPKKKRGGLLGGVIDQVQDAVGDVLPDKVNDALNTVKKIDDAVQTAKEIRDFVASGNLAKQLDLPALAKDDPRLARMIPLFPPVSLVRVQQAVLHDHPEMRILMYFTGDDETLLFVVTPGDQAAGLNAYRIPVKAADLQSEVQELLGACNSSDGQWEESSARLYEQLIAPAAADLKGAKRLIIVPDGDLHTLPFQVLRAKGANPLVKDYTISYAASVSSLVMQVKRASELRTARAKRGTQLLAVGNPKFGTDFNMPQLDSAEKEANEVAGLYGTPAITGSAAVKPTVKAEITKDDYLLIATHGIRQLDPMMSYLALAAEGGRTGMLFAQDILDLDTNAELSVMSACQTALGQISGEGVTGLTWSWFSAGVPSVVGSLWSVNDEATHTIMVDLFGNLKSDTAGDKAEALRNAQVKLMQDEKHAHPYYWAPFVLCGAW